MIVSRPLLIEDAGFATGGLLQQKNWRIARRGSRRLHVQHGRRLADLVAEFVGLLQTLDNLADFLRHEHATAVAKLA